MLVGMFLFLIAKFTVNNKNLTVSGSYGKSEKSQNL